MFSSRAAAWKLVGALVVGGLLFVTAVATRVPVGALTRELPPFLLAHFLILALITFVPAISTWLPHVLGF